MNVQIEITEERIKKLIEWIGEENVRWFGHLKGLTGTVYPALRLNQKRKFLPVHPVGLREGMKIRNWMRNSFEELKNSPENFTQNQIEEASIELLEKTIKYYDNNIKNN